MGTYNYPARVENESFVPGELLGFDPVTRAVRKIRPFDEFAGFVPEQWDFTDAPVATFTHGSRASVMVVSNGRIRMLPDIGVVPVTSARCYAATGTTFSHDPSAGSWCGCLESPDENYNGSWIVNTTEAFINRERVPQGVSDAPIYFVPPVVAEIVAGNAVSKYDVVMVSGTTPGGFNIEQGNGSGTLGFFGIAAQDGDVGDAILVWRGGVFDCVADDAFAVSVALSWEDNAVREYDAITPDQAYIGRSLEASTGPGDVVKCEIYWPYIVNFS